VTEKGKRQGGLHRLSLASMTAILDAMSRSA
jgi:hypothetical protein